MARIRKVTLAELNRLYPGKVRNVTLFESGYVQSFRLVGDPKPAQAQAKTGTDQDKTDEAPDAVDLAFNPPAGMLMPLPTEDQN